MHALITGASSGIGEALAKAFSERGAAVTLVARRETELVRVARGLRGQAHVEAVDVGDLEALEPMLERARSRLGPVGVLVNNAGVEVIGRMAEVPSVEGERLLRVNLLAPLRLTRLVLPEMAERRQGSIVDVSSVAAFATPPYYRYYGASKAGMAAASEALRGEAARAGVHVLTVYPGPIRTPMGERAMGRLGAGVWASAPASLVWGSAAGLARRILDALAQKKPRVVYPEIYRAMQWFPGASRWIMDRFMPELEGT